jgi:hypothetical protein
MPWPNISRERLRVEIGTVTLADEGYPGQLQVAAHGTHYDSRLKHFKYN